MWRKYSSVSPVEVFLHHFGDGTWDGFLLRTQARVEVHAELLLQEVDDELCPAHLLLIIRDPRHLPLRRQLPIEVVLRRKQFECLKTILLFSQSYLHHHIFWYLVGQVRHPQVRFDLQTKGGQARDSSFRPGKLMQNDGVFRVQLLFLPTGQQIRKYTEIDEVQTVHKCTKIY